jgi:hypothetical protein
MRLTRILMQLAMIVILLPWGAYPRAPLAVPAGQAEVGAALVQTGARMSAPKTCRTAVLPGFGCVLDPVIPVDSAAAAGAAAVALWSGPVTWDDSGRGDPPPKAPPRPV